MHPRSSTATGGRRRHLPSISFLLAVAVGCCLALAACGGSGGSDPGGETAEQKTNQQMVRFAKCLREHGVQAETNSGPKGFGIHISGGPPAPGGKQGPPPAFKAAQGACRRYAPTGPFENLSPAQKAEEKQKAVEFARCMRSHGVDVPDPGASGVLELSNIDPQSATFQSAQNACNHLMGKLPLAIRASRGAPGGPPHGGGQESSTAVRGTPGGGGE